MTEVVRESAAPATAGDLLTLVRAGRAATRSELGRLTGLSRTAVTSRVGSLVDAGLLLPGEETSTGGRPAGGLVFNADAGVVLAVAIGRSRSQVAVCDLDGGPDEITSADHPVGTGPDELLPQIVDRLAARVGKRRVLGVGVSLPGAVDSVRGASLDSPVMTGWDGVELAPYFTGVTDAPLFVGNDADVLARSERIGQLGGYDDLLVLKASTGLGLGIIADGRVVSGHIGAAGEIGHTKVDAAAGLQCRCGDVGCVETLAGGWAIAARLAEEKAAELESKGRSVTHVRDLVGLALEGDRDARGLLRESGRRLGEVLAVAINLLNPQAVVVGGDMAAAFDIYAAGLRETIYSRSTALATRDLRLVPATYGDRAGVIGCAALALDHVLSPGAVDAHLAGEA